MKIIRLKKNGELSAEGKRLLAIYNRDEGYSLDEVYYSWSNAKERAYDYCWHIAFGENALCTFHICSHNSFGFTVAWLNPNGDVRIQTMNNSYLVEMP